MIDETPFVRPDDRFPSGLPGHTVPLSSAVPTPYRPWGMDSAVLPIPLPKNGGHEKPTKTYTRQDPTEYTDDSKVRKDTTTVTVTD